MYTETNLHKPTLRVVEILEAIARSKTGLNLSAIARETKCPKSTLTPILKTLTETNYLTVSSDTLIYNIGKQCFFLGNMYHHQDSVLTLIKDQMVAMVNICHTTCHLGVLQGSTIFYLQKVSPARSIQLISSVGKSLPAYATALGKSLLMDHTIEQLTQLFPNKLPPLTSHTISDIPTLYNNIHLDPYKEFTYEVEEITEHARCIAHPLRINGKIVAAISMSYFVFDKVDEELVKNTIRQYATIIERLMETQGFNY